MADGTIGSRQHQGQPWRQPMAFGQKRRRFIRMKKTLSWVLFGAIVFTLLFAGHPSAKEPEKYPAKGIDIIVSVSAGGTPDVMARLTSEWLSKYWGKPVTVINKPGGGAIPGALEVLSATGDGYTVGTITSQNSSQQHGANKKPTVMSLK
jgi:tripartite-type tricarboxylate transporter receptor subunit TctC